MSKPDSLRLSIFIALSGLALVAGCFSATPSRTPKDDAGHIGDASDGLRSQDLAPRSDGSSVTEPTNRIDSSPSQADTGSLAADAAPQTPDGRTVEPDVAVVPADAPPDARPGSTDVQLDRPVADAPTDTPPGPPPADASQRDTLSQPFPDLPPDQAPMSPPDAPVLLPDAGGAPLGTVCTEGSPCASGVCADGVCCDGPCTGCKACTFALTGKTTGQCNFIQAGKVAHSACTASATTCGTDGYCDGSGACRVTASGTPCGSTCTGSTYTPNTCNGAGACTPGTSSGCAPYACAGDVCATSCEAGLEICGSACVDKLTNPSHCGSCNHSCLGGTCAEGMCQPYLLADEAAPWEGVATFMITGDKVFIEFGARAFAPADWAVDIGGGGAVKLRDVPAVSGNKTRTVALDGRLYWFTISGTNGQLLSCPQNSCTAGNTTTVLPISCQDGWTLSVPNIIADPVNHEVVWHEVAYNATTVVYSHAAKRSGPNGPERTVASYVTYYSDNWVVPNNSPNRVFSLRTDDSSWSTYTLYSLLTTSTSASPLAITGSMSTVNSYANPTVLANSTAAFVSTSGTYSILRVPLPNGVTGVPSAYYTGNATWSLVDDTSVYGTTVGSTNDGIWRCSISNCSPSYIARGFLTLGYQIISDSSSVYVLDRTSSGARFKLWRMAK